MFQVLAKVACGNLDGIPANLPRLTSDIFTIIEVAVPVLLVIMGTIDLFKGVAADKEDEMIKSRKMFVKRLITGSLVFFIIAITKFVVSIVDDKNSGKIMNCVNCFINNDCQSNPDKVTTDTIDRIESHDIDNNSNIKANPVDIIDTNNTVEDTSDTGSSSTSSTSGTTIKAIDSSEVVNVGDSGVSDDASGTTKNKLVGKETGSLTKNYSGLNYYLYVPTNATEGMPLVIFLHGIGEQNNITALKNLKPVTIITDGTLSGLEEFIFLAPNSTSAGNWHVSSTWDRLITLITYITNEYSIDTSRIYITGFSAGGCGVWGLVNKYPNKFRAAVAVSCTPGSITPSNFKNTPIYAISGGAESYVSGMQNTVNSINKAGGNAQFKTIPNANHIATQNSYSTRELYSWLLSQ